MKKNFIVAGILSGISLICAALIAGIYLLTSPIISNNTKATETKTCKAIFSAYDEHMSTLVDLAGKNQAITKVISAKNSSGEELGLIYTVTGKNDYGTITLMIAIKDGKVYQVEFLENGQSFASTVNEHVKNNYPSSKDEVVYPLIKPADTPKVDSLDGNQVANINVSCGATYGATTVKELVTLALNDAKGAN